MEKNNLNHQNLILYFSIILITAIIISLLIGYLIGDNINSKASNTESSLTKLDLTPTVTPTNTPLPTPYVISSATNPTNIPSNTKACLKYGLAQKWEYLTSYVIKDGDSIPSIAKTELKDETRVNEIIKINGVNQLIVGSTLYLPPTSVSKSSGNLKQIYGKLVGKDSSYWKILLSSDLNGQSMLIPSFVFEKVSNKNNFKAGDCIKVFLDDGYEAYTVSAI